MDDSGFDHLPQRTAAHAQLLQTLCSAVDAMAIAAKPDTEIVVHDLSQPESSIVKIVNGYISGRRLGYSLVTGPSGAERFAESMAERGAPHEIRIVQKYESYIDDQRAVRACTAMYFDASGTCSALLCVNVDPSLTDQPASRPPAPPLAPSQLESRDTNLGDVVAKIIDDALQSIETPVTSMTKADKISVVSAMHQRGLFMVRGSVELAAARLSTTKFSIYKYLEELGVKSR